MRVHSLFMRLRGPLLMAYLLTCLAPTVAPALAAAPLAATPSTAQPAAGRNLVAKIVFLGDSLTAGYGLTKEAAFPALLASRLQEVYGSATEVVNAGVSGATSASGLSRLDWQLKGKPTHLVLALGANDGLRGFKLEETKKNLSAIITRAREHHIKVLLAGMKLPPNYGPSYTQDFESMYAGLAKTYQVAFMPFLLQDVGAVATLNLSDGIHPNAEGHKVIAKNLWPYLEDLLKQP